MLCYVMLCYVMLCYVMLCYVMLCYVMLCYVMLCYVMLCYVMLCYVMLLVLTRVKYYYGFQIRILHLSQLESLQAEHQILNINHSLKQRGVTAKARWLPVLVLAFQLTSSKRQKWGQGEALRAL